MFQSQDTALLRILQACGFRAVSNQCLFYGVSIVQCCNTLQNKSPASFLAYLYLKWKESLRTLFNTCLADGEVEETVW